MKSTSVVRETVTTVTKTLLSPKGSPVKAEIIQPSVLPNITWEQFLLVNFEIDRLTTLCSMVNEKNKALLHKQDVFIAQNELLREEIAELRDGDSVVKDLVGKNKELRDETRRLESELDSKDDEVEEWKAKYAKLEKSMSREGLNSARNATYNSDISKISEGLARYRSTEALLSARKRTEVNERIEETTRVVRIEKEKNRSVNEIEKLTNILTEFKTKLAVISEENAKLNQLLNEKQRIIETLNVSLRENQRRDLVVEKENEVYISADKTDLVTQLEEKIAQLLVQNRQLAQEKDAIRASLASERREFDGFRGRLSEINILASQIKIYDEEKKRMSKLVDRERNQFKLVLIEKDRIINELRAQSAVHVQTSTVQIEYNEKIAKYTSENEKLNVVLVERARDIEALKARISQLETEKHAESEIKVIQHETVEITSDEKELQSLKLKLSQVVKENEALNQKLRETESLKTEVQKLTLEKKTLEDIMSEKINENQSLTQKSVTNITLEAKLSVADKEKESLKQTVNAREKVIEELKGKVESLTAKVVELSEFEKEFEVALDERDDLRLTLDEKGRTIKTLEKKLVTVERDLAVANELKGRVSLLDSESKYLSGIAMDRLCKLNTAEQELEIANTERKNLSLELAERMTEIGMLKMKVIELQAQADTIPDLKENINLLLTEKDRVDALLEEKFQELAELQYKYATLEHLYLHVRGQMKKPEVNDKKYQEVIRAIEKVEFTVKY